MKRKLLFAAALLASALGFNANAQTDVTADYIKNADFSEGTPVDDTGICTYGKDMANNGVSHYGVQEVTSWTGTTLNGDDSNATYPNSAVAGGLVEAGRNLWTGGKGYTVPGWTNKGTTGDNLLALLAVWKSGIQYTQETDKELPAGDYTLVVSVYNAVGGTTAFDTNLIGVQVDGTNKYATAKTYSVNTWTYEYIPFSVETEGKVTISLGYISANNGNAAMPHLFIGGIKLYTGTLTTSDYETTSKEQLLSGSASGATASNPVHTTVVNGTFDADNTGWSATGGFSSNKIANNQAGAFTGNFWENWNASAKADKMYQTIEGIPNGTYSLNIAAFVETLATDESQYVFANNDKFYLIGNEPIDYEVLTVVTDNKLEIGLEQTTATSKWLGIDNVSLTYYGPGDVIEEIKATSTEYDAFDQAIAIEESLGYEVGQYVPWNNVEAVEALLTAKKTIDQTQRNSKYFVNTVTKVVTEVTWTENDGEKDIVYNSNFAEANGTNPKGWTRVGNGWGQQQTGLSDTDKGTAWYYNQNAALEYGTTGGYIMPLEANTWYVLEFKYRSQENNTNKDLKVSVLNADGDGLQEISVGANGTTAFVKKTLPFQTGEKGNYVISLANTGNTFFADVYLTKVVEGTANLSVKAGKYGTFAALFEVETPEGVEAYTVEGIDEDNVILLSEAMTTIPAGTPVILKNTTEKDVNVEVSGLQYISEEGESEYLKGVYTDDATVPADSYVLQTQGSVQAFYVVEGTFAATPNRAYLTKPANGGDIKAFYFNFADSDATAIKAVPEVAEGAEKVFYNLAGQRVANPTKGIYIVNGQKVLVK